MSGSNSPITTGVEFESVINSREAMQRLADELGSMTKGLTRDASVESVVGILPNGFRIFLGSSFLRKSFMVDTFVAGYELVSQPLMDESLQSFIMRMTNIQAKNGEIFSERSSIHIHSGFPTGFVFYKPVIALGLRVEPLLYKLAGMGNEFRGLYNNCAYCRPLALPPAVAMNGTKSLAVLDPEGALWADDEAGFWGKLGTSPGSRERYNPLRYFGINVFSVLLRGTLEFRHFNFCNNGKYVEAVASLCQTIADVMQRVSVERSLSINQISIFDENSDREYIELFYEIIQLSKYYNAEHQMSPENMDAIIQLIRATPQPMLSRVTTRSHITNPQIGVPDAKRFQLDIIDSAPDAGTVDIHNFESAEHHLLGGI
jgi:hypothetical protein